MRVLFAAPPAVGLLGRGSGVYTLMRLYERALSARGHEVEWLDPWATTVWREFDAAHLFQANGESAHLGERLARELPLAVSPIVDRRRPAALLRCAVHLGRILPGVLTHLGQAAKICARADRLALMCHREGEHVARGLGVRTPAEVVLAPVEVPMVIERAAPERLERWFERPFLLFLGDAGNPRKNVLRLVDAMGGEHRVELLLAGPVGPGPTARRLERLVARSANVTHVGFLSPDEKAWALSRARALVLPSLTEGIGLAAVEAAARGTTVVVTRHGGAPDYLATAAHYIDPRSVGSLRRGLQRALAEPLDARQHLRSNHGIDRAGQALERFYRNTIEAGRKRLARAVRFENTGAVNPGAMDPRSVGTGGEREMAA